MRPPLPGLTLTALEGRINRVAFGVGYDEIYGGDKIPKKSIPRRVVYN